MMLNKNKLKLVFMMFLLINRLEGIQNHLKEKGLIAYKKSDKAWSYLGKTMLFTRSVLNASLNSSRFTWIPKGHEYKVSGVVTHLKVFSIIGVPLSIAAIPSTVQKIFKSFQLNDREGTALSSLSVVLILGDMLDTVGTFVNAAVALASKAPIQFFSVIGLPLAVGLVSLGSMTKAYQLIKTHQVYKKFNEKVLSQIDENTKPEEMQEAVRNFLGSKLEDELKKAKFQRAIPSEVLEKLETLSELSDENYVLDTEEVRTIVKDLMEIKDKIKEKMTFDIASIVASIVTLIALCLMFTGAPIVIAFILLAVSMGFRLVLLLKQDFFSQKEEVVPVQMPAQPSDDQILTIDQKASI